MIGERIKELRNARLLSLEELGQKVNKSAATISRYENNRVSKQEPKVVSKIAEELDTSIAFLMGMTDDPSPHFEVSIDSYDPDKNLNSILVTDDDMSPQIPQGAFVKIRNIKTGEKLQVGSYYYIKFNDKKCFRLVIEDDIDGVSFLPNDMSERRIAYDTDYVKIIGKAVSMKVIFDDHVEFL